MVSLSLLFGNKVMKCGPRGPNHFSVSFFQLLTRDDGTTIKALFITGNPCFTANYLSVILKGMGIT